MTLVAVPSPAACGASRRGGAPSARSHRQPQTGRATGACTTAGGPLWLRVQAVCAARQSRRVAAVQARARPDGACGVSRGQHPCHGPCSYFYQHDISAAATSAAPTPPTIPTALRDLLFFFYFWCRLQVVFKVKVPRTEARAAQQSYVPVNDDVIVDGFVDEGLTSEVARMQAYNLHAMYGSE